LERFREFYAGLSQSDTVLRTARASQTGLDAAQVQLQGAAKVRLYRCGIPEQSLLFAIGFHTRHLLRSTAGEPQVGESLLVNGEDADRGAIFGSHIGDGGAIGGR